MVSPQSARHAGLGRRNRRDGRVMALAGLMLQELRLQRALRRVEQRDEDLLRKIGLGRRGIETAAGHGRS